MSSCLCVIPARSGSTEIPDKNILPFAHSSLLDIAIKTSLESNIITRTVVSTDSSRYSILASASGAEIPVLRPDYLSTHSVHSSASVLHMLNHLASSESYIPEYVVMLLPTSPLRTSFQIDQALSHLISGADSLVSVLPLL